MHLSTDDLVNLAGITGVLNVLPVHEIYAPDVIDTAYYHSNVRVVKRDVSVDVNASVSANASAANANASSSAFSSAVSSAMASANPSLATSSGAGLITPTSSAAANATTSAAATSGAATVSANATSTASTIAPANSTASYATFPRFSGNTGYSSYNSETQVDKLHAAGYKGKGVKIAIIDGGVDYTRPALGGCFGPQCRVKGGYDFVGNTYNGTDSTRSPGPDPLDTCYAHGSVTATMIIADGKNEYNITGVAPESDFYVYRVFGCTGKTSTDLIMQAAIKAYQDGVEVINMSLSEESGWTDSALSLIGARLVAKGVSLFASVGNRGQVGSFFGVGPAAGAGVVGVGAANRAIYPAQQAVVSTGYGPITYLNWQPWTKSKYPLVPKLYYPLYAFSTDPNVTADGCSKSSQDLTGKIVIVRRGTCAMADKADYAAAAGAAGIFIVNSQGLQPVYQEDMLTNFGVISYEDGNYLLNQIAAGANPQVAFDFAPTTIANTWDGNTTALFSQIGPTNDMYISTQVVAPGGNLVGVVPYNPSIGLYNWTLADGTSFSAPMAAGAAALYIQAKGRTSPAKIYQAFENTAKRLAATTGGSELMSIATQGSGMIQAYDAIFADTLISPAELNLNDTAYFANKQYITIKNTGRKVVKYTVDHVAAGTALTYGTGEYHNQSVPYPVSQVSGAASVDIAWWDASFTLLPGLSKQIQVTFTAPSGLDAGEFPVYSGFIQITGGSKKYQVPYLGLAATAKKIPIVDYSTFAFGFHLPIIMNAAGDVQNGTTSYTFSGKDYPTVIYRLVGGTRSLVIDLVKSDAKLGFTPNSITRRDALPSLGASSSAADVVERDESTHTLGKRFFLKDIWCALTNNRGAGCSNSNSGSGSGSSSNTFAKVPTVGRVFADADVARNTANEDGLGGAYETLALATPTFSNGTTIPKGSYRFLLRALKNTGTPTKQEDYESWLSQPFVVA